MKLTTNHQLPYPDPDDRPDVAADLAELAHRLDHVLGQLEQRIRELEQQTAPAELRLVE